MASRSCVLTWSCLADRRPMMRTGRNTGSFIHDRSRRDSGCPPWVRGRRGGIPARTKGVAGEPTTSPWRFQGRKAAWPWVVTSTGSGRERSQLTRAIDGAPMIGTSWAGGITTWMVGTGAATAATEAGATEAAGWVVLRAPEAEDNGGERGG